MITLKKIEIILKAWAKVFKGFTTKQHIDRAKICRKCPSAVYKTYMDFINDELEDVKGFVCTDCGCPLVAKIRSEEKCDKWEK